MPGHMLISEAGKDVTRKFLLTRAEQKVEEKGAMREWRGSSGRR